MSEVLYDSARTRVVREGPVIRKRPLGADAPERLRRELDALRRLAGVPGTPVLSDPQEPGVLSLVAEPCTPLSELPAPVPSERLIELAEELAGILAAVHRRTVVHRDVCPANVLITADGRPVLIDFELAGPPAEAGDVLAGTLPYLAPEQSGRTGRPVDHRADLYALGAALYELATGEPPFGRDRDPLHLVHDHLAREPEPPGGPLSQILMRLLRKEPEQRYQSGEGLAYDLELLRRGELTALGERDFPLRLAPPARLVGRDAPMLLLRGLLERPERGMALVTGPPGVGKTALIHRLRDETGVRFVAGKFDQYRRDLGADAVRQAFCAIGSQLLAEPDEEIAELRKRLLAALGPNAGLAAAVLPPFAALLGVEPEEADDPWLAVNRIQRMGRDLLRTVAGLDRPLVIFIDDLQWAGPTAYGFLTDVLNNPDLSGVLVVGAYRESEVDEAHPLSVVITRLGQTTGNTAHIRLANLPPADLGTLLADMLRIPAADVVPLAAALQDRTAGNPFDTVELVNALRRDGALVPRGTGWTWDEAAIRHSVGVVDLLGDRILALPQTARDLLEAMAVLGGEVPIELLELASGHPGAATALLPAIEDGLVTAGSVAEFRHDRVQQAAYGRLHVRQRAELALAMARRLAPAPDYTLAAAGQYRAALDLIVEPAERTTAARLLRQGAAAARAYTNNTAAEAFLAAAVTLTDDEDVRAEWHTVLCGLRRFEEADVVFEGLAEVDRAVAEQVVSLTNRGRLREALDLGLSRLAALGVVMPEPFDLGPQMAVFHAWLAGDRERPIITDPRTLAVARLIDRMVPAAFYGEKTTMAWLVMRAFEIWAREGTAAELVGAVGFIGFITSAHGDFRGGYEAARRIIATGTAHGWEPGTSQTRYLHALAGLTYFEPVEYGVRTAHEARDGLLRGGDLASAASTCFASVPQTLDASGLDTYAAELDATQALCERTGYDHAAAALRGHRRLLRLLRGEPDDVDADAFLAAAAGNDPVVCWFETTRALAAAVLRDERTLAVAAGRAVATAGSVPGTYVVVQAHVLRALGATSLDALRESRDFLAARAADQPGNFRHLYRFAEALFALACGDDWAASRAFDEALSDADEVARPWHRALILERAGLFQLSHRMEFSGRRLLSEAMDAYAAWGAHAKVRAMAAAHPDLAPAAPRVTATQSLNMSTEAIDLMGVLEASRAISSETDLDRLRARVEQVVGAMTGATSVRLLLRDEDSGPWTLPGFAGSALGAVLPESAVRYAERTGEPMLVDDVSRDDRVARDPYLAGVSHGSLLVVPLPRAMLVLENRLTRRAFTTTRLNAVTMLVGQLTVSLDNARLYASLERKVGERTEELAEANRRLELLSVTDALTGLPNRRKLNESLDSEWERARRPGTWVGLAMIDIDNFKLYNDHYGHQGGDDCLALVARTLRENVRGTDIVARYGGEEFCIVMPGADVRSAFTVADRARGAVAALGEPHAATASGIVTISVGVAAAVPLPGSLPEQLLKLADEALYDAKRGGRNRVCVLPTDR